jgi:hypothetical protein
MVLAIIWINGKIFENFQFSTNVILYSERKYDLKSEQNFIFYKTLIRF